MKHDIPETDPFYFVSPTNVNVDALNIKMSPAPHKQKPFYVYHPPKLLPQYTNPSCGINKP